MPCLTCNIPVYNLEGDGRLRNADGQFHICDSAGTESVLKKGMPTEEQAKEYKTRLSNYVDVLNKGGMKPSEIIGGAPYKLRAFVRVFFPQTPEQKNLTVDQWNAFFGYLDGKHEELGAEGLVKLINEKLGVKE